MRGFGDFPLLVVSERYLGFMKNSYPTGFDVPNFVAPPRPQGVHLEGDAVRLVPLDAKAHGQALFEAYGQNEDANDWLYLPYGPFAKFSEFEAWLGSMEGLDDPVFFTIIRKSDERPVGVASFLRINPKNGVIEVGHIHYSPELQRSIMATKAQYLLAKWVFEAGYRRYEWKCDALNLRSRRAASRLGFSYEGVFRQAVIYKGRNRDTAWFAMTDKDWGKLRAAYERYLSAENFDARGLQKTSLAELTRPLLFKTDDGTLNGNG